MTLTRILQLALLSHLAWDPSLGIFRSGSFAGIFRLGSLDWDLSLGTFRFGTFAWELLLGNFRLGTFAWELSLGRLCSGEPWGIGPESPGESADRRWGNRPGRDNPPAL